MLFWYGILSRTCSAVLFWQERGWRPAGAEEEGQDVGAELWRPRRISWTAEPAVAPAESAAAAPGFGGPIWSSPAPNQRVSAVGEAADAAVDDAGRTPARARTWPTARLGGGWCEHVQARG